MVTVFSPQLFHVHPYALQLKMHVCNIGLAIDRVYFFSLSSTTSWISDSSRGPSNQAYGLVAMEIHPEQGHKRYHVADVYASSCRVDTDVGSDSFRVHQVVEIISAPRARISWR